MSAGTEDWTLIDGAGPADVDGVGVVTLDESEVLTPSPGIVYDSIQDVRSPLARAAAISAPITATAFLNAAKAEIGYREGADNDTKYGRWYGMNHQAYCAMGLTWVAAQLNALPTIGGRWAYCPYWAHWARQNATWSLTPARGDIVFFDWTGQRRQGREAHVGVVYEVAGSAIKTVEFNTVPSAGNQSDGGGVYARSRAVSTTVGFFRPKWSPEVATTPLPSTARAVLTVDGAWGPMTTRRLQQVLRVPLTGRMDQVTIRAMAVWLRQGATTVMTPLVKTALQSRVGVARDGIIGPGTVRALQRYLNRI